MEKNKEDNSGHVSKVVHQFYFVKLWPTEPDSISKITKEENIVMKMNQDISEFTDKIAKKTLERDSVFSDLNSHQSEQRDRVAMNEKILRDFNMALDELNIKNIKVASGGWFGEKLDKNLHGSKSLADEKQILREIKIQQKEKNVASFKSLEVLKETLLYNGGCIFCTRKVINLEEMIRRGYYLNDRQKLVIEIEQFQIKHMERASKYDSLKKSIKDQIKLLCDDDSLKNKRERMECGTRISPGVEAIDGKLHSLREKLNQKYKKKYEAKQRILQLKELYDEKILHYYKYCSLINKVHQLAEEKDVAVLDEMSISEVEKFMLEWNNNKGFREDYEKNVLQSLERRQLSRDGRRTPYKSCSIMLL